jgi:hypothetical protein
MTTSRLVGSFEYNVIVIVYIDKITPQWPFDLLDDVNHWRECEVNQCGI